MNRCARVLSLLVVTAVLWGANPLVNLQGSSRPAPLTGPSEAAPWPAPPVLVDDIATPMIHRRSGLPVRLPGAEPSLDFYVEREVVERYGKESILGALERWGTVRGSRLEVRIAGVVDDGVERNLFDGVNRIFVNRRNCSPPELGKAHVDAQTVDDRFGDPVILAREVNIGICPHTRKAVFERVLLHEVGHAVGFGHLCEEGDRHGCWAPEMGDENRCRVMYSAATACQEWSPRDNAAVIRTYPLLPRLAGPSSAFAATRAAHVLFPRHLESDTVVVVDREVDEASLWSAAALAGTLRAPFFVAPADSTACGRGEFAREVARVSAYGAEALLVGAAALRCAADFERWGLETRAIRSHHELTELTLERASRARVAVIVGHDEEARVPAGAVAAALAGQLGAPLLFIREGRIEEAADTLLAETSRLREVVLVGDRRTVPPHVHARLTSTLDLGVERLYGYSSGPLSLPLLRHEAFASSDQVVVASTARMDAVVAVAYAPTAGAVPLLVPPSGFVAGTRRALVERIRGGYVIGSELPEQIAAQVNVWIDAPR